MNSTHEEDLPSGDTTPNHDAGRRSFAALIGAAVGALGMAKCADPAAAEAVGTSIAAATGTSLVWVDTIADLRRTVGSTTVGAAVVGGYYTKGDGGGGVFAWTATTTDAGAVVDDGGTVIVPLVSGDSGVGTSGAGWIRIYSGPISVKWFGAYGGADATSTQISNNVTAINNAFAALPQQRIPVTEGGLVYDNTTTTVEFPEGIYKIDAALNINPATIQVLNIVSDSTAVIDQTAATATFSSLPTHNLQVLRIRGLKFLNGLTQILIVANNNGDCVFTIEDCDFEYPGSYSIVAKNNDGTHLSAILTVSRCRFFQVSGAVQSFCDKTIVENCSVTTTQGALSGSVPIFHNAQRDATAANSRGCFLLKGLYGTCGLLSSRAINSLHWVENWGTFIAESCRFGGEGGGMPIVYNYAGPSTSTSDDGPTIRISNCDISAGLAGIADSAVINLIAGVPETIILEGNNGPYAPLVIAPTGAVFRLPDGTTEPSLAAYLAALDVFPVRFNIALGQSLRAASSFLSTVTSGTTYPLFAPELQPYVNYLNDSPFPIGPRRATIGSPAGQASFQYVMPETVYGFAMMITVSYQIDPTSAGFGGSRAMATFLVSMTTGYGPVTTGGASQAVNYLWPTVVSQPHTPGFDAPTLSVMFDGTGAQKADSTGAPSTSGIGSLRPAPLTGGVVKPGGTFTVTWKTSGTAIVTPQISCQVVHVT